MTDRTYEMAPQPPPPMPWNEYALIASSELASALDSNAPESEMHALFERHPCLLPGRHGEPLNGAECAFPCAVISKPPLPSWGGKIPDFMWIASDSVTLAPVLIEIEAPGKPWFTSSGQQSHALTQALNQLQDWRLWFETPHNRAAFLEFYKIDGMLSHRLFRPEYVLVYGRRSDSHKTDALAKKRGLMQIENQSVVSYDRLVASASGSEYMCAKVGKEGYQAISLPPTLMLGPLWAEERALIAAKDAAIETNGHMSAQRKEFLKERMPYWDKWAHRESKGTRHLGDCE